MQPCLCKGYVGQVQVQTEFVVVVLFFFWGGRGRVGSNNGPCFCLFLIIHLKDGVIGGGCYDLGYLSQSLQRREPLL